VGLPQWSDEDQQLAKALQKELKNPRAEGAAHEAARRLQGPVTRPTGGGSTDIGDISWNVPTVTLHYPSNIPACPAQLGQRDLDGDADRAQGS
jgi:aminobenzoyl-glutamate utilization protein B